MSRLQAGTAQVADDPLAYYELALSRGWCDGAPLIPPTDERVEAMLAAVPLGSQDVVDAQVPPQRGNATVELVAINAVMAGCEPAAFALVLAAMEAMTGPAFNAYALATTTGPVTPMLIVNGPCRDRLGIDYRAGCLGGAAGRGSMTIGRAVSLCLRNIGGLRAGVNSQTVFGQPARFGLCFGEWEERCGWPSLAVRRGFGPGEDVVTVHGGMGVFPIGHPGLEDDRDLVYLIGKCVAFPLHNLYILGTHTRGEVVVVINPMWAERFARTFAAVESFQECLYASAWQPIDLWPAAYRKVLEDRGRVDSQGRVHAVVAPDRLVPVVCGGLGNFHCSLLTSWGESEMQSRAAKASAGK